MKKLHFDESISILVRRNSRAARYPQSSEKDTSLQPQTKSTFTPMRKLDRGRMHSHLMQRARRYVD